MARTIQKKIKFSKGQIVPDLIERTDLDLYDTSAQEMTNVVSSVYGGVRSRRGTRKIDRIFTGMTEKSGTATSGMGGTASYIQDKKNRFVSSLVNSNRTIFTIDFGESVSSGKLRVRGIKFDYKKPTVKATVKSKTGYYYLANPSAIISSKKVSYQYYCYSGLTITDPGIGNTSADVFYKNPNNDWKSYKEDRSTVAYKKEQVPKIVTNPVMSFTYNNDGSLATASLSNGGKNAFEKPNTTLIFKRNSTPRKYKASFYYSTDGNTWVKSDSKTITETPQDFDFSVNSAFRYVKLVLDTTSDVIKTTLSFQYAGLVNGAFTKGPTRLFGYVYNNQDKYVLSLADETISIYQDDMLIESVAAGGLSASYFDLLKWTYKDDTIIFTHPDMSPKILKRLSDGTWSWGDLSISNIPYTLFGSESTATKTVPIKPSNTDGTVKITADSSVFSSSWVGQYIDGNGGRVKITEYVSGTVVNGYTVIPFYTDDKINSWTYISGYEAVWSASKGWPRTCLFAQQRLWFGGSKSKPSTVWASRLGDYFNFKNSGNYDNDAIDVDLLTNDIIVNMVENRGIHIFTTGQEISSADNSFTPDKISFTTNTRNGSMPNIIPVIIDGTICYVEKNGKSLLSYVYSYEQASYLSNNISLFTDLIQKPVCMSAEINSEKDRGDFLYMVLEDGTMIVGCVLLDQKVMSLSSFVTDGLIKDVCSVGSDTYLLVDRGNYYYLEKIDDVKTDLTTQVQVTENSTIDLYEWSVGGGAPELEVDPVYTFSENPEIGDNVYDIDLNNTGKITNVIDIEDEEDPERVITVDNVRVYNNVDKEYYIQTNVSLGRFLDGIPTKSVNGITVLSDYNNKLAYLYDGDEVYEKQIVQDGKILLTKQIDKMCNVGIAYDYKIVGNPIAINHKTTSIKKRITTADIVCQNTPMLNFCGQIKEGKDNYKFFACTKYGDDVRYTLTGEFYKMDVLSVQLNINYEG